MCVIVKNFISRMKLLRSIFMLILLNYVSAEKVCCPPGQAVLLRKDLCWEPLSNTTIPMTLKCVETIKFVSSYSINENDQLVVEYEGNDIGVYDQYCMGNGTTIKDVTLNKTRRIAIICSGKEETIIDDKILGYCMIVSVIFLTLTAVIYGALPELRDVQGKSIINFCGSLAIGLAILTIMKLMEYSDMALCATRGFLAYFFLMAAFFWTNAISIQILLNTRRPSVYDHSWKTFKWYMLYAWGCATVLTVLLAIVNFHPNISKSQKPGIGLNHCWFFNTYQMWYYMYSVMSLLLAANIGIFIYTSVILWRLSFSSSHMKALKYKFTMTVRLIVLMGLPWVFEMISSLAPLNIVWVITDVFNTLQGLLIFILLVVLRRRVVKLMHKHHWLDCISGLVEKHLAVEDDEENVVQHTDLPMNDRPFDKNIK